MALLLETEAHIPATRRHDAGARTASVHLVPTDGVLLFPGAPAGIAPPAQLGPMMSPPSRGRLYGR